MPITVETLDTLPGEGETQTVKRVRLRQECAECGEPAHYKLTYLLKGSRGNPASSAYGKDDCSWCEDECAFACAKHADTLRRPPEGYVWCSSFPANERFAHLFLYWHELKD